MDFLRTGASLNRALRIIVKAVTLIFIFWRGSALSSAQEGEAGSVNLIKVSRANVRALHENHDRIYTELTFINPLSACHKRSYDSVVFEAPLTNSV